jgi:hypothetical protein
MLVGFVLLDLVLCLCFVDRCLSCCPFSFGHCVVCSSSYSDYSFGIFKVFFRFICSCIQLKVVVVVGVEERENISTVSELLLFNAI